MVRGAMFSLKRPTWIFSHSMHIFGEKGSSRYIYETLDHKFGPSIQSSKKRCFCSGVFLLVFVSVT